MTHPGHSSDGARFVRRDVPALPEHAAGTRQEFSNWLTGHFALDRVKFSDIVLAVNEALANAVDAAYAEAPQPGVMHVQADYHPESAGLTVIVTDEGTWRPAMPRFNGSVRGRGIPLMEALTDRAVIEPTDAGTRVCLQWDGIAALPRATSGVHDRGSRTT